MNTNNGAESLNKLLKYSFLPRKKSLTLSTTVSLLIEKFLPVCHEKYLFQNYKQSGQYRSYKSFVPDYLYGRPRNTILHCLERKTKALKYLLSDISPNDLENGEFTIKGTNNKQYKVNFGVKSTDRMPSCTCQDWITWHLPCKHFFAIFNLYPHWGWKQLPNEYLNSAYLCMDTDTLHNNFSTLPPEPNKTHSTAADVPIEVHGTIHPVVNEIPTEKVQELKYNI